MKNWIIALIWLLPVTVLAEEDGSYVNYDGIVNELKSSMDDSKPVAAQDDLDWEDVALHGGLALASSYVSVTAPNGIAGSGLMKGVSLGFGMNLFSRKLRAEGAFSSYSQEDLAQALKADLKEFELRLVALPALNETTSLRFGIGLAARYLNLDAQNGRAWTSYQASTPSSLILVGFERRITPTIAFGPDISYRAALVGDTYDKSAWDASFRLNATF